LAMLYALLDREPMIGVQHLRAAVAATAEYQADQDLIGQFFAARVRADDEGRVKAADLYKRFKAWWEGEGFDPKKVCGPTTFGREAKRKFHSSKGSAVLYHARILPESEPEADREGGRVEAVFRISAHARARSSTLTPDLAPTLPPSHDPADQVEREGISLFGGG